MSRMVAIASGKGGVGKTFLSATLAHALVRRGRRCLVFDGDLGLANLDVQLGIAAAVDLAQVLHGRIDLAEAVIHHPSTGLDLVVGRSGSGLLAGLPPARVAALGGRLRELAAAYDLVLLDLAAGIEPPCRILARAADEVVVVTTDEPTALTDAYAFVKVVCDPARPVGVVVNFADDREGGRETYRALARACRRFLGLEPRLLGVVRRDPRVADAIRVQMPFLARHPRSVVAEDIERLAATLLEPAPIPPPGPSR